MLLNAGTKMVLPTTHVLCDQIAQFEQAILNHPQLYVPAEK